MSNQPEQANQQFLTSEELRQNLLTQIEASKQSIEELSDEELEGIAGGFNLGRIFHKVVAVTEAVAPTAIDLGSRFIR